MRYADYVLFDDRPGIELGSNVMASRTYEFYSPFVSARIGTGSDKRG